MSDTVLANSAKGATFLILLQVGSRALTFIVNQVLLRFLSPELLGTSTHLELYSISILFFARESIRVVFQRQTSDVQVVVNLAYVAILIGVPLIYALAILRLQAGIPEAPYFVESLQLYGLATFIELLSEPAFAAAQQKLLYGIRASAETTATIGRCIVTCGTAIFANRSGQDFGVLPFAFGQLAFSALLLLTYVYKSLSFRDASNFSLLPQKLRPNATKDIVLGYFSRSLSYLTLTITLQSVLKYFLTQGDALLSASLTSLHDQGTYALASAYGGLVARMLFQPIEESSRNLFAKLCATDPLPSQSLKTDGEQSKKNASSVAKTSQQPPGKNQAATTLSLILRFYALLSLAAVSIGPTAAPLLLSIIAGRRWSATGAGEVLATYCYYIPLLATNGVTEAFVAAVASPAELGTQSIFMSVFFGIFAGALWWFLGALEWGAHGLVWANCINMALRIVYNVWFIDSFFKENRGWYEGILPSPVSIAATAVVVPLLASTKGLLSHYGFIGELVRVGGVAFAYAVVLLAGERNFLLSCYRTLRPSKAPATSVKTK